MFCLDISQLLQNILSRIIKSVILMGNIRNSCIKKIQNKKNTIWIQKSKNQFQKSK